MERAIPAVPEDEHDVGLAFVAFNEARERFERQAVEILDAASARLGTLITAGTDADRFVAGTGGG